jgi:hypothetical protein
MPHRLEERLPDGRHVRLETSCLSGVGVDPDRYARLQSSPLPPNLARRMHIEVMDLASEAPHAFQCPNLGCNAKYVALPKDHAPDKSPRCTECNTPFLPTRGGFSIINRFASIEVPIGCHA